MAQASDGKVIISTELDNSKLPKNITEVKGALGGLKSIVKDLGTAIASAFAIREIAQFAQKCIDLGSDLQEIQNVLDVTFSAMNEQVNAFAKNAMHTAGLSESMAKKYAGTFGAMAKSFKFTEAEAYGLSTSLTQLAGDIASFYNLSQDEAYTKLKSVFTGETESLKDIGVVMTQTALDAYALEKGLGKTTAQMTEQEKVALRYRFVMDQLSTASGDFIRTSDSWANQTRLLSLQFEQLKATIGAGLINALTPVIRVINTIIAGLQTAANAFHQFTAILFGNAFSGRSAGESIAAGYGAAAEEADNLASATAGAAKEAKKSLAAFDEINKLGADASGGGASAGGGGGVDIGELDTVTVDGEVQDNLSPKLEALANKIKELFAPFGEIDFKPLEKSLGKLSDSFEKLGAVIGDSLEWAWYNILVPLAEWTIEEGTPALIEALAAAFEFLAEIIDEFAPIAEAVWEDFLAPLAEWTGKVAVKGLKKLAKGFGSLTESMEDDSVHASDVIIDTWEYTAQQNDANFIRPTREDFENLWGLLSDGFKEASDDIVSNFEYTAQQNDTNFIQPTKEDFANAAAWISEKFTLAKGAVVKAWEDMAAWFDKKVAQPIREVFGGIWDTVTGVFKGEVSFDDMAGGIANIFKDMINSMIRGLNSAIVGMVNRINPMIQKIKFFKFMDEYPFGALKTIYPTPQIPYLAQGAVLPANKPFMAVVGDQKHGTNVEAPLDTIKQALAEVLALQGSGDINITFTGDLAQLARVLKPVIDKENRRVGGSLVKGLT